MKVRYITEGYFKNPTQAKEAREKAKELSNAEKVAGVVDKIIKEPIIRYLDWVYNKFSYQEAKHQVTEKNGHMNDRFDITPACVENYCFFLRPWKSNVRKNDLCGQVTRWAYSCMNVEITDIDIPNKTIKLRIVVGDPQQYKYWGKKTFTPFPTDMVVLFVNLNGLADSYNNKFDDSSFTRYALENYLEEGMKIKDPADFNLPKESVDFLKDKELKFDYEVIYQFTQDVVFAGVIEHDVYDLQQCDRLGGIPMLRNDDDYRSGGHERENLNSIYHFVKDHVKKVIGVIPYISKNNYEDCSWESYTKSWIKKTKFCKPIIDSYNSFEEVAKEFKKRLEKMKRIKIEGNSHIYYSTGYFKKNILVL